MEADSVPEAEGLLQAAIITATGDGEPYLEFDPPLPFEAKASGTRPEYFDLGWNESASWNVPDEGIAVLHEDGVCPRCGIGKGKRTAVRREVTSAPRYDFSGFYKDRSRGIMLSEAACKRLLDGVQSPVQRVEVSFAGDVRGGRKQKHYELSAAPQVSSVYPRDMKISSGWKCPRCRRANMFVTSQLAGNARYCLRRSDAIGDVIFVQYGPWVAVAISKRLREQLSRDRSLKGLVTERASVLDDDEIMSEAKVSFGKLKNIQV